MKEVYIVFGDALRTDGANIEGVFFDKKKAEEYKVELEEMTDGCRDFSIETHNVMD